MTKTNTTKQHDSVVPAGSKQIIIICRQLRKFLFVFALASLLALNFFTMRTTNNTRKMDDDSRNREGGEAVEKEEEKKEYNKNEELLLYNRYVPARIEEYVMDNADSLGLNTTGSNNSAACPMWKNESSIITPTTIYEKLHEYVAELNEYGHRVDRFALDGNVTDLRDFLEDGGGSDGSDDYSVCKKVDLHEGGLQAIFQSGQLSYTSAGWVEPLLPPMRHPMFCLVKNRQSMLMSLTYLVHDFATMCRKLKRTSRTVLVDMGASLDFHGSKTKPAVYLTEVYKKFGIPFDHIYAYEIRPTPAEKVYKLLPSHMIPAYHWINMGVDTNTDSPLNPLNMILSKYREDDLIVVKLDVDNPAVETALARQLAADDRLTSLVDHFYFEHHMHVAEMARYWGRSMNGSAKESLELFATLRKRGVAAHYWV